MQSGDRCPKCREGRMKGRSGRPVGEQWWEKYFKCEKCHHTETAIVPVDKVWRRS